MALRTWSIDTADIELQLHGTIQETETFYEAEIGVGDIGIGSGVRVRTLCPEDLSHLSSSVINATHGPPMAGLFDPEDALSVQGSETGLLQLIVDFDGHLLGVAAGQAMPGAKWQVAFFACTEEGRTHSMEGHLLRSVGSYVAEMYGLDTIQVRVGPNEKRVSSVLERHGFRRKNVVFN